MLADELLGALAPMAGVDAAADHEGVVCLGRLDLLDVADVDLVAGVRERGADPLGDAGGCSVLGVIRNEDLHDGLLCARGDTVVRSSGCA
jgi:hypothetical protein